MSNKYNGWANYPTWCINLWLTNDSATYDALVRLVRRTSERKLYTALEEWVEELLPDLGASFSADLLGWAVEQVDWHELAEHYMADLEG
jgi:hypothetical protein